jgi:hypothetical protein
VFEMQRLHRFDRRVASACELGKKAKSKGQRNANPVGLSIRISALWSCGCLRSVRRWFFGVTGFRFDQGARLVAVCVFIVACILVKMKMGCGAVQPPTPAVRHAARSSAFRRGRNSGRRQLLISSGASLCFGLKTTAKIDPIPMPTKRNVIAELKSYSLLFIAPSINTSLPNE